MNTPDWDAIVLGVGGAGSAALYHLAARGLRVLGIERHAPGHSQGSSHGGTRAIRLAYFEGLTYIQVAERLGEPEGTVKSRIRRGMHQLARLLGDRDG